MTIVPSSLKTVVHNEIVPAGSGWSMILEKEQLLRITDVEGNQGVDFLCFNADNPRERYHAPNTIKAQQNIRISKNSVLYSDYANPLMTVVEDTIGNHDTIAGCCSSWSNEMLYGVSNVPGCRENFLTAMQQYGLGWQDIVPNINFFCYVPVEQSGETAASVFVESGSKAGDYVELRAEMRVIALVSNCPQVNNPCNNGNPTPIKIQVRN